MGEFLECLDHQMWLRGLHVLVNLAAGSVFASRKKFGLWHLKAWMSCGPMWLTSTKCNSRFGTTWQWFAEILTNVKQPHVKALILCWSKRIPIEKRRVPHWK